MGVELFFPPGVVGLRRPPPRVGSRGEGAVGNLPAIVALVLGTGVGAYTAGVIPGIPGFGKTYIGFPALQAWVTGAVVYLVLAAIVARSPRAKELLGYSAVESVPASESAA